MDKQSKQFELVQLSQGVTHFELKGNPKDPLVLLLHGMGANLFLWQKNVEILLQKGFRYLRIDLYGRGRSEMLTTPHSVDVFVKQMDELLRFLKLEQEPIHVVGCSMGGGIATHWSSLNAKKVRSLTLISPAGFHNEIPWIGKQIQKEGMGERIPVWVSKWGYKKTIRSSLHDRTLFPAFFELLREQTENPAFFSALLSSLRHFPVGDLKASYERVGQEKVPTALFWGEEDEVVPFKQHKQVLEAIPHTKMFAVQKSGHICCYETPDFFNPRFISFLKEAP